MAAFVLQKWVLNKCPYGPQSPISFSSEMISNNNSTHHLNSLSSITWHPQRCRGLGGEHRWGHHSVHCLLNHISEFENDDLETSLKTGSWIPFYVPPGGQGIISFPYSYVKVSLWHLQKNKEWQGWKFTLWCLFTCIFFIFIYILPHTTKDLI